MCRHATPVGVVLAGGASSRMGRDKALLGLSGSSLVERAAAKLAAVCYEVLLADGGRETLAGHRSVADHPARGPAAGILGAAAAAPGASLLVLACDLPLVPVPLLELLAAAPPDVAWMVPRHAGRVEPLCALYRPPALAALAARVSRGDLAPHRLADGVELAVRYLDGPELAGLGDPHTLFLNVNRPDDLRRAEAHLARQR